MHGRARKQEASKAASPAQSHGGPRTFSTLAYRLMSISLMPPVSTVTFTTASRAMSQMRSPYRDTNLVPMQERMRPRMRSGSVMSTVTAMRSHTSRHVSRAIRYAREMTLGCMCFSRNGSAAPRISPAAQGALRESGVGRGVSACGPSHLFTADGACAPPAPPPPSPTPTPCPHVPRMMTDVVPSPTSSSCVRDRSIMLLAAGWDTSISRRMALPSLVTAMPPMGSSSILSMERGPRVVRITSATACGGGENERGGGGGGGGGLGGACWGSSGSSSRGTSGGTEGGRPSAHPGGSQLNAHLHPSVRPSRAVWCSGESTGSHPPPGQRRPSQKHIPATVPFSTQRQHTWGGARATPLGTEPQFPPPFTHNTQ